LEFLIALDGCLNEMTVMLKTRIGSIIANNNDVRRRFENATGDFDVLEFLDILKKQIIILNTYNIDLVDREVKKEVLN